ncbi:MAG: hypothetical protein JW836_17645 [Deltaproteobacteria bacterium]|nr:hypothetical protein [Deltaproteobacteria bacterium]
MRQKVNAIGMQHGLIGKRFGDLVVLRRSRSGRAGAWIAKCDCGRLVLVYDYLLKSGSTTSCGCKSVKQEPEKKKRQPRIQKAMKAQEIAANNAV